METMGMWSWNRSFTSASWSPWKSIYLPKLMANLHVSSIDTSYHLTFVLMVHLAHLAVTNILCTHLMINNTSFWMSILTANNFTEPLFCPEPPVSETNVIENIVSYMNPELTLALKSCSIHYFLHKSRHFSVYCQICFASNSIILLSNWLPPTIYCSVWCSTAHRNISIL